LNSPELKIDAIIASYGNPVRKAKEIQKLLHIAGRDDIPVIVGKYVSNHDSEQLRWAADWRLKNVVNDGARALVRRIMRSPEKVTLIPYGPLTDIAEMLKIEPKVKEHIDEIILMGGSIGNDAEYNIREDTKASQIVFESGVPIVMAGLEVTAMMQIREPDMDRIEACQKPLVKALFTVYKAWGRRKNPTMYDPVALAIAFQRDIVKMEYECVKVTDKGFTQITPNCKPNTYVCVDVDKQRFMKLFIERILK